MSNRQIPKRDADELKRASTQLVERAGGVSEAARLTQATPSRVSEAISQFHDARWLSLIQVADLECATGEPVITRALAGMAGFELVARERAPQIDMHRHLTHIITECGDVERQLSTALQDGHIDAGERRALREQVRLALVGLRRLDADLADDHAAPASTGQSGPGQTPVIVPGFRLAKR